MHRASLSKQELLWGYGVLGLIEMTTRAIEVVGRPRCDCNWFGVEETPYQFGFLAMSFQVGPKFVRQAGRLSSPWDVRRLGG